MVRTTDDGPGQPMPGAGNDGGPGTDRLAGVDQDDLRRAHRGTPAIVALAPLSLLVAAVVDSAIVGTPLWTGLRGPVLLSGTAALCALIFALGRVRDVPAYGWLVIAMLCVVELSLALIATPTPQALPWLLPIMLAIPLVAAPFWIHPVRALACCVASYACAGLLPWRVGLAGDFLLVFICQALVFTLACMAVFATIDRVRRGAYRRQQHLEHEARHDALTGLPTRRRFLGLGERAVAAAAASGEPLCLAFVDLDTFKAINDRHGHAAGDAALRIVAERLSQRLLADMVAARMGGEEFVLLLPGVGLDAGTALVDALRREVASVDAGGFGVTVSAGVARLRTGETLAQLMLRADKAMLAAKAAGRNRVLAAA